MGRLRLVALVVAVAACIKPAPEIACGDLVCPGDAVCLANNTCVPADQASACDGLAEGAACTTASFDGTCRGGACFAPVCGDGVIEGSEQCDGPVTNTDCVAYGFDLGVPTCTNCVLDLIGSCERFGWKLVVSDLAADAWTDGARLALVRAGDAGLDVYVNGVHTAQLDAPVGMYTRVIGDASAIVAYGSTAVAQLDGATFDPIDASALLGDSMSIASAALTDDGTLHAAINRLDGCTTYAMPVSGAWASTFSSTDECDVMFARDGVALLATHATSNAGTVWTWNGSTWTMLFETSSAVIALDAHAGSIYATTYNGIVIYAGGVPTPVAQYGVQSIGVDQGLFVNVGTGVYRDLGDATEQVAPPINGTLISDGQHMYDVGDGIYVYSGAQYAARLTPNTDANAISLIADGSVAISADSAVVFEDVTSDTTWDFTVINDNIIAAAGASRVSFYAASAATLYLQLAATSDVVPLPIGASTITGLWAPTSGAVAVYVIGTAGFSVAVSSTGATTSLSLPAADSSCDFAGITGDATTVLAVGACGTAGVVWQLAGSQWTELHREAAPLAAVALDPAGDIFVTGLTTGARAIGGVWTEDPEALGASISAVSPDDVWVAGGPEPVIHWDGTVWSRLGVVGAAHPRVVATERTVYLSGTSNPVLVR